VVEQATFVEIIDQRCEWVVSLSRNSAFSSRFNNGKKRWINYLATVVAGRKIA